MTENTKMYSRSRFFLSDEKKEEWEKMPANLKMAIERNLNQVSKKLTTDLSIELLSNMINDILDRLDKLEKKND